MAGYKMQGKTADGSVVDIPLAATYDANGNEIATTYAKNSDVSAQLATIEEIIKYRLPLAVATWEQINAIGALGIAPQVWKVGDEKPVTLTTGEKIIVQIWDFDHDTLTGGGKAPISFGLKEALSTAYKMNNTNTNAGGWGESVMRTSTLATIFNYLPDDVKTVIKAVDKKTSAGNLSSTLNTTSDKLWLPSHEEVFGTHLSQTKYQRSFEGEGHQYAYFAKSPLPSMLDCSEIKAINCGNNGTFYTTAQCDADGNFNARFGSKFDTVVWMSEPDDDGYYIYNYNGIKGRGVSATSPSSWWLRSPYYDDSSGFCYVSSDGSSSNCSAGYSAGVAFGFCV